MQAELGIKRPQSFTKGVSAFLSSLRGVCTSTVLRTRRAASCILIVSAMHVAGAALLHDHRLEELRNNLGLYLCDTSQPQASTTSVPNPGDMLKRLRNVPQRHHSWVKT